MATQPRPPIAMEDVMGEHTRTPSSEEGIERLRSDLLAFQDLRSRTARRRRAFVCWRSALVFLSLGGGASPPIPVVHSQAIGSCIFLSFFHSLTLL
jgi:hypothetical protein